MAKWQWVLKQFGTKLWLRTSLFCILGLGTAFVALLIKDFIPEGVSHKIGAEAVDDILHIIASSMLAVTTFSLSIMVAAYSAATSNATPRATQLMLNDNRTQNALSVFIGSFVYSIVGIIALSMEVYNDSGRLVLFVVTIIVIALIIIVLLKWIDYLSKLGRVRETIDLVERATAKALQERIDSPYLGGVALHDYKPHESHHAVTCGQVGYVQHIDMNALSCLAEKTNAEFFLCMIPGSFNDGSRTLFYSSVALDEEATLAACRSYIVENGRSFDQDPRFGMVVLNEIAMRALSPAVNDPGTAIDVIGTSIRVLVPWISRNAPDPDPLYNNIYVPPLCMEDILDDLYGAIVRDAADNLQIAIIIQKALASIAQIGSENVKLEAIKLSQYALSYVNETQLLQSDKDKIDALSKLVIRSKV